MGIHKKRHNKTATFRKTLNLYRPKAFQQEGSDPTLSADHQHLIQYLCSFIFSVKE